MRKFISILLIAIIITSCKDDNDNDILSATTLPMGGDQEVPAKQVAGLGTIDAYYNRTTHTLYYTVKWTGLTGPIITGGGGGFHIHGPAKRGAVANPIQTFSGYPTATAGTFSGSVYFDGVVFKEQELLNGEYYINIHTSSNPSGEIRGQLENFK